MTFWNWRRGSAGGVATGSAAVAMTGRDLAPIELYTADARIVGWIAANGQRVTDLLNDAGRAAALASEPRPDRRADSAPRRRAVPEPGPDDSGEWQSVMTEQLILAMPPEWRAARQLRLHRKLRRVALSAGPFSVTGNLHLVAGNREADEQAAVQGRRFLPLTDAYILHNGEPPFEHVVSVVIVNTAHITRSCRW